MVWAGVGGEVGTRVHPWQVHVDVWQNQYTIVKQKEKRKKERKLHAVITDEHRCKNPQQNSRRIQQHNKKNHIP